MLFQILLNTDCTPSTEITRTPHLLIQASRYWESYLPIKISTIQYSTKSFSDSDFDIYKVHYPDQIRLSSKKRKAEYLAGRRSAAQAMARLEHDSVAPRINPDKTPSWPETLTGSISHTSGWAVAAVAYKSELISIGLDIEVIFCEKRTHLLERHVLTEQEVKNQSLKKGHQYLTLYFSIKESLYKCLQPITKKKFYFHDAEIYNINKSGLAEIRLLVDLSPEYPAGTSFRCLFQASDNFIITLSYVSALNN